MATALHQIYLPGGKIVMAGETFNTSGDVLKELIADGAATKGKVATQPEPATSDDEFEVPDGYSVVEKGGGWYEVTGPEGFEPVKAHGADNLRQTLADIATDEEAPAS